MINAILRRLARATCRSLDNYYRFPKASFYCEHLWLRVSIHQDGRMEPCSCAISQMEPQQPAPSIQSVWNNSIYKKTRQYLIDKLAAPGKVSLGRQDIFDCCTSCPLTPTHRLNRIYLRNLLRYMRGKIHTRFANNPWLFIKKMNNFRKLAAGIKAGSLEINAHPIFANIDPASVCNIRCLECEVGKGEHSHPQGVMTLEAYSKILQEIGPTLFSASLFRYGEPLLNKNILRMIDLAENQYGIFVSISTNFSMPLSDEFLRGLVSSGLTQMVIAADDIVQELYVKYRKGGDVRQVIKNLENLVRIRKELNSSTPEIVWQTLIFNFNEDRKDEIKEFVGNLGVDTFVFSPAYLSPGNYDLRPRAHSTRGQKENKKSQVLSAKAMPSRIKNGEKFTLEVEVIQNFFEEPIPASTEGESIKIGIKLADKNKSELKDFGRILFDKPLAPGEKVTLAKELLLPQMKNAHEVRYLKIDLVMEHQYWFEQNMDIQSLPYFLEFELKKQPVSP